MARFTGTSRGKAGPEEQFQDAPGKDTEDSQDFPKVLEDAEQPKEGELGTSKSKGKTGDQPAQATEGAEAPSEETLPVPNPTRSMTRYKKGSHQGSHGRPHPDHHPNS